MDISINNTHFDGNGIIWAITASILLHLLIAVVIPNFNFTNEKEKRQVLKIELQQPAPPAPIAEPLPPINIPAPPKPEPIKKKIKPIVKPKPIKKTMPLPVPQPEVTPPSVVEEVIAVQPTIESAPEVVVPQPPAPIVPPEPIQKVESNDNAIRAAQRAYQDSLVKELKRNHRYPKIAARRGIQGIVMVLISIDKEGNVIDISILESSGNASLDKGAIATVKRSNLKQFYPDILRGTDFKITTPISFTLKNS